MSEATTGNFGPFSIKEKDPRWQAVIWATFTFWSISSQGTKVDEARLLFPLSSHSISLCVLTWVSYKCTSHWIMATVMHYDLILTNYISKNPNFKLSHTHRFQGLELQHLFSGGHNAIHSHLPPPLTSLFTHSAQATLVSSCSQTSFKSSLILCFTTKLIPTTPLKMENHPFKHSLSFVLFHL